TKRTFAWENCSKYFRKSENFRSRIYLKFYPIEINVKNTITKIGSKTQFLQFPDKRQGVQIQMEKRFSVLEKRLKKQFKTAMKIRSMEEVPPERDPKKRMKRDQNALIEDKKDKHQLNRFPNTGLRKQHESTIKLTATVADKSAEKMVENSLQMELEHEHNELNTEDIAPHLELQGLILDLEDEIINEFGELEEEQVELNEASNNTKYLGPPDSKMADSHLDSDIQDEKTPEMGKASTKTRTQSVNVPETKRKKDDSYPNSEVQNEKSSEMGKAISFETITTQKDDNDRLGLEKEIEPDTTPGLVKMKTVTSLHKTKEHILTSLKQYIKPDVMALLNKAFDTIEREIQEKDSENRELRKQVDEAEFSLLCLSNEIDNLRCDKEALLDPNLCSYPHFLTIFDCTSIDSENTSVSRMMDMAEDEQIRNDLKNNPEYKHLTRTELTCSIIDKLINWRSKRIEYTTEQIESKTNTLRTVFEERNHLQWKYEHLNTRVKLVHNQLSKEFKRIRVEETKLILNTVMGEMNSVLGEMKKVLKRP
ncbi:hypothetical protein WDU94_006923, partial [Cyamophila willieti]